MLPFEHSALDEILSRGWVQHAQWFDEIDSTNDAARRSLQGSPSPALPSLFVAHRQTAGRGRGGHPWWSPDGCLMLTLVLPSSTLPADPSLWCQLALVSGLAVARTAAQSLPEEAIRLKWPNDVYVNGRKLAGILIESAAVTQPQQPPLERTAAWLIGIGMNVNIDWQAAPVDVARRATCLSSQTGRSLGLPVVLVELIDELQRELTSWLRGDNQWLAQWRERCLLTGKILHVRLGHDRQAVGVCEGVDGSGRLIIRDEQGVQSLTSGEVLAWQ